jgi:hypothetical protein
VPSHEEALNWAAKIAVACCLLVLESPAQCWLVVSVSTAGAAGSLRVQVLRKLRSLGALYLRSPPLR